MSMLAPRCDSIRTTVAWPISVPPKDGTQTSRRPAPRGRPCWSAQFESVRHTRCLDERSLASHRVAHVNSRASLQQQRRHLQAADVRRIAQQGAAIILLCVDGGAPLQQQRVQLLPLVHSHNICIVFPPS